MMRSPVKILPCLQSMVRDFRDDRRGLAALEFALIVPLMFAFFFGMIETTNGFSADRKVSVVARTLSDLTSRAKVVNETEVENFFTIGAAIMQPYSSSSDLLKATISEVWIDPKTSTGRVQWSRASAGAAARTNGQTVTVPAGLISKDASGKTLGNQYLILSEVSYVYKPTVAYFMNKDAGVTLSGSTFTRPRQSSCVYYPNDNQPCPTS